MDFNWYVFFGLLSRLVLIIGVLAIVMPQQMRELKKYKTDRVYRWLLLTMSMGFIVFSVLPISYQSVRLDSPSEFNLLNLASLSGNLAVLFIGGPYIIFYSLVKRSRRRTMEPYDNTK